MQFVRAPNFESAPWRTSVMVRMAYTVSQCDGPDELLRRLVPLLQELLVFDVASLCLPSANPDFFAPRCWVRGEFYMDEPELPRAGTPSGWVWENQRPLLIADVNAETRFSAMTIASRNVSCFLVVPLSTGGRRIGTLGLASSMAGAYGSFETDLVQWLGGILALGIENALARAELLRERDQTDAVLAIQKVLSVKTNLPEALPDISRTLQGLLPHCAACLTVLYAGQHVVNTSVFYPASGKLEHRLRIPIEQSLSAVVLKGGAVTILQYKDMLAFADYPLVKLALEKGARAGCLAPLATPSGHTAVVGISSPREHIYQMREVRFLEHLSAPLSVALENDATQASKQRRQELMEVLAEVNGVLLADGTLLDGFAQIAGFVARVIPHECAALLLYDAFDDTVVKQVITPVATFTGKGPVATETLSAKLLQAPHATIFEVADLQDVQDKFLADLHKDGIRSLCVAPMSRQQRADGAVVFGSTRGHGFCPDDAKFFNEVASRMALALDPARLRRELHVARSALNPEPEPAAPRQNQALHAVLGRNKRLRDALDNVDVVAASDTTVLILGETGTGKDMIAKAIHATSRRIDRPFIKLNCAAIPTGLLESELFGHEKGSFTSATSQKIGRMEIAHKGTLFLDEIGEIPLELQPKLLRLLQDQEFERLGGNRTIKVDVRLIAATNRDLQKAVAEGQFRSDLYYRLNVFPIRMPALRDRQSDIPDLVRHFVRKHQERFSREIEVSDATMEVLSHWSWPGNVRELENFIERSVILTEGGELRAPLDELRNSTTERMTNETLEQNEREHILHVLRETGGALSGPHGAAAKLGLKRTTLQSKMQKLGITRSSGWQAS